MKISTTNSIPNHDIIIDKGVVYASVVVGTNIFSDFAASLRDIFGGYSGSYQSNLQKIYGQVIKEISREASIKGCNAIIGLKIDFDEISGKEKSMFMVNAVGTACIINEIKENSTENLSKEYISKSLLELEIKKRQLYKKLVQQRHIEIDEEDKNFLVENPSKEFVNLLLDEYLITIDSFGETKMENFSFITKYIMNFLDDEVINKMYALYEKYDKFIRVLKECNVFSAEQVKKIFEQSPRKAIKLLEIKKQTYCKEDIKQLESILLLFESLPDTGRKEIGKGSLFSKEQMFFFCQSGHKNNADVRFCETCGVDIKGMKEADYEVIEDFKLQIETLKGLFKQ